MSVMVLLGDQKQQDVRLNYCQQSNSELNQLHNMPLIQHKPQKRSVSQNRNSRFTTSPITDQLSNHSLLNKKESAEHEEILRERARRFVARMRKQKEYIGGKYVLKKQLEEKRKEQEQKLIQSLKYEKQKMQKSIKMTMVLERILANQCRKERKLIKEMSQQLKSSSYESSDQDSKRNHDQVQSRSYERQTPSAKRFKTFESQPTSHKQQSPQIGYLPPITKPAESNLFKYHKPGKSFVKPKQDRQIYLNKLDQMKLKSIDSKIKKLRKFYSQILDSKS